MAASVQPYTATTAELSTEVEKLVGHARTLIEASRSRATRAAYAADWSDFASFCDRHGFDPLPADPAVVAVYLTDMVTTRGLAVSTIQRRASALSVHHVENGHISPIADPTVRRLLQGIRRMSPVSERSKRPISPTDLSRMIATCDSTINGLRDRALLAVGFVGGLRRSELTALNVGDLDARAEGLTARIRRSKTDQEGHGRSIALPYGFNQDLCPVTALDQWLTSAKIERGAVFRRIRRGAHVGKERLTPQSVSLIIKSRATEAGLDSASLSGHSLRSGFATTAALRGASERAISRQTGHKSMTVLRRYVQPAQAFDDNAATDLGI